jgi:hypothetical protein
MNLKFEAWDTENNIMYRVGDDYGTTSHLEPIKYLSEGQPVIVRQYIGIEYPCGRDIFSGDICHIVKDRFGKGKDEIWTIEYGCFGDAKYYVYNQLNSCREIETEYGDVYFIASEERVYIEYFGNKYENSGIMSGGVSHD